MKCEKQEIYFVEMNNAKLYSETSSNQQNDASSLFDDFLKCFDGLEFKAHLDIGCGPGDTLVDIILPKLNPSPVEVVGIDISEEMIIFAKAKYGSEESLKFFVNDIQSDFGKIHENLRDKKFDLISILYCYHWVRDDQ